MHWIYHWLRFAVISLALICVSFDTAYPQMIWDESYVILIEEKTPFATYREKAEILEKRSQIRLSVDMKKMEEGHLNEESMGSVAKNAPELSPLFYHFRTTYRSQEMTIDGTIDEKRKLTAKITESQEKATPIQVSLPSKAIFASHFPLWLHFHLKNLKQGKPQSFTTFLEDQPRMRFRPESGWVKKLQPDAFAQKEGLQLLEVDYRSLRSRWYVRENGSAVRIDMPSRNLTVLNVSHEKAEKFLSK